MSKTLLVFGLLVVTIFGIISTVAGEEQTANNLLIKVDHVAGKFEKLKEKISLLFKFNKKDKAEYYQYLAEKRLAELSYVIESDRINSVEETASRYTTYIGTLADFVMKNEVIEEKDDLVNMFERHAKIVEEIQRRFNFESGWWLALQHDINTARLFRDKVKELN